MGGKLMTYCMVPDGIGGRTLRALERYAEETGVTLVCEHREAERRTSDDRRNRPHRVMPR